MSRIKLPLGQAKFTTKVAMSNAEREQQKDDITRRVAGGSPNESFINYQTLIDKYPQDTTPTEGYRGVKFVRGFTDTAGNNVAHAFFYNVNQKWEDNGVYQASGADSVDTNAIQDGAVTTPKIADGSITLNKLDDELQSIYSTSFSKNLFDVNNNIPERYIDTDTGEMLIGGLYTAWNYIDLSPLNGADIVISRLIGTATGIGIRVAMYDENKQYLWGSALAEAQSSTAIQRDYFVLGNPNNQYKYMRISFLTAELNPDRDTCIGDYLYYPYKKIFEPIKNTTDNKLERIVLGKDYVSKNLDVMNSTETIEFDPDCTKSHYIFFKGNIDPSSDGLVFTIGHATDDNYGAKLQVNRTLVIYNINGTETTQEHKLIFKDYVSVEIRVDKHQHVYLTISTNGDYFTTNFDFWMAHRGRAFFTLNYGKLNDVSMVYKIYNLNAKVWLLGDSYLSFSSVRWPYYLPEEVQDNILLDSFPGADSYDIEPTFLNLIKINKPQYCLYLLGMNDKDPSELNARWQVSVEEFLQVCSDNNITPILATIPNTKDAGTNNTYKNKFVRGSDVRYIDFAKAVRGEDESGNWYDGMLSSDLVHPTAEGAKKLCSQVIADFPEILNI